MSSHNQSAYPTESASSGYDDSAASKGYWGFDHGDENDVPGIMKRQKINGQLDKIAGTLALDARKRDTVLKFFNEEYPRLKKEGMNRETLTQYEMELIKTLYPEYSDISKEDELVKCCAELDKAISLMHTVNAYYCTINPHAICAVVNEVCNGKSAESAVKTVEAVEYGSQFTSDDPRRNAHDWDVFVERGTSGIFYTTLCAAQCINNPVSKIFPDVDAVPFEANISKDISIGKPKGQASRA